MKWLVDFQAYICELRNNRQKLIISGDFNICRLWIDIHNPEKQQQTSGFLPEEREWFQTFIDLGFTDSFRMFNNEPKQYSWWSYRAGSRGKNLGWRIDYHLITQNIEPIIKNANILPNINHSDHCPVSIFANF